jgi:hypothetical protein
MKTYIDFLVEAGEGPRIPHPEDSVFQGSAEAVKQLQSLQGVVANPKNISIKWDGMIALYFGRDSAGQFFIADKYMPAKGIYPKNPNEWVQYDQSRGANRADLYAKINAIWPGLEAAVGRTTGIFKGDLMFIGPLQPMNGYFVFKPVTVEYRVPVNSDLGKLIEGRRGMIVVHQYNDNPWNGKGLTPNEQMAVIPANMGINFRLKSPVKLTNAAAMLLNKYGNNLDVFLGGLSKSAKEALLKYLMHFKVGKTKEKLSDWLRQNVSNKQYQLLIGDNNDGYLIENRQMLDITFKIWNAIASFKENLAQQLEGQVQGFEQYVNGSPQGEGFVVPTAGGLVKLVQRGGFSAAHFAGFNPKK